MGGASRSKGRRGEQECVRYFRALGLDAQRVSPLEAGRVLDCDVLVRGEGSRLGWPTQVKNVAKLPVWLSKLMAHAHIGWLKETRGRTYIVVDADDLWELAELVVARRSE